MTCLPSPASPPRPLARVLPLLLLSVLLSSTAAAADRPNLLFVLSDDQRNDFLGSAGHPFLQTPHLDALAERGTRFENAFVTTSICAASRATILTGLYETGHGFTFGTPPLEADELAASYPALLRQAGYRTGFFGKFGVAIADQVQGRGLNGSGPWQDRMFDEFAAINRNPYFKTQPDGTLRHTSDLIGDRGVAFIESAAGGDGKRQPWCLSISFNAGHAEDWDRTRHYPYPFAEAGLYENADIPEPLVSRDFWERLPAFFHRSMHRERYAWRWDTPEKYRHNYRNYCRLLTGMDRNVGRLVDAIDRTGQRGQTVVVFIGDNGYYAGSRGFAGKWSHYEESLRVPLLIAGPGTQRDAVSPATVLNLDIAPTILDFAGINPPASYQGTSLRSLAAGESPDDWRTDFYIEHRMDRFDIPQYEGVRGPRFKYARYVNELTDPDGDGVFTGEFLHDRDTDPQERRNLATDPAYREQLDAMRQQTDAFFNAE